MDKQKMKFYAEEAVDIIKDTIVNNELVKSDFIAYVGCSESGDRIILRDLLNYEKQYSLSEVSYIFTDYVDGLGAGNHSAYETVLASKDTKNKDLFMQSLFKLKQIEQCV